MASKGPKPGAAKPASEPKPNMRVRKAPVPKAKLVAAPANEKRAPDLLDGNIPPVLAAPAPVAAAESAPTAPVPPAVSPVIAKQEATVPETVESAPDSAAPVSIVAAHPADETVNEAAAVEETVAGATPKEVSTMETTIENNTAKAQAVFADWNEKAKSMFEKSGKLVEDANEFAKGNLEAVVESGRIAAKGLETLGQEAAEYSRKSFENATAALKTLATAKSPTEFFKLQSDFVRGAFDAYVAEASKQTEAMLKLAGDAAQPISSRVAVAMEKAKQVA